MQKLKGFYKTNMGIVSYFSQRPERVTVDDLMGMMKAGERFNLLDVRALREHVEGRIPGSILASTCNLEYMEAHSFEGRVILYCTAGIRSYRASKRLAARGIRVVDLVGGIDAWEDAGGEVMRG